MSAAEEDVRPSPTFALDLDRGHVFYIHTKIMAVDVLTDIRFTPGRYHVLRRNLFGVAP